MKRLKILLLVSSIAATNVIAVTSAEAQETSSPPKGASSQVEEIVVTAQHRNESLQDVPIAVAAIQGDALAANSITSTSALDGLVPSLVVTRAGNQNVTFLRGVGANAFGVNVEQSVATYVDGVYIYSPVGNMFPFNKLERIEVLKGPQGTLFGRNSTGGVINIITPDPSSDTAVEATAGYGNYDTVELSGYATTGLSENVAIDLSVYYKNQGDGWGRNLVTGKDIYYNDQFAIRSKILLNLGERTQVRGTFSYGDQTGSGPVYQVVPGVRGLDGVVRNLKPFDQAANLQSIFKAKDYLASVQINHDFDFASLVSITTYRKVDTIVADDADATPTAILDVLPTTLEPSRSISQELRLSNPSGSAFDWMIGAYYLDAKGSYSPVSLTGSAAIPGSILDVYATQRVKSASVFGQVTVPLGARTKVTAGLRYTHEKIALLDARTAIDGVVVATAAEEHKADSPLTARLAIAHDLSDDINVYLSYNRGFKSGGYNLFSAGAVPAFNPEKLDAYELGFKSQLFDRRLRFNVAAYLYNYRDIQLQIQQLGTINVFNAAKARMWGVDGDLELRVTPALTLTGGLSYEKTKYTSFPSALAYPASGLDGGPSVIDATGNRTPFAPVWSGNLGLQYKHDFAGGALMLNGFMTYAGKSFVSPDNRLAIPKHTVANASIQWTTRDEHLTFRLWGANIFNEIYPVERIEGAYGDLQATAAPRTYGVSVTTRF